MKLAIVAYPKLDESDRQWIEAFRAKHDPQAARLAVHFTLVFPVDAAASDLEPEVEEVSQLTQPIAFAIRCIKVVRDALGSGTHIFLVPEDGGAQITKLHDRLYAGRLRAHLRTDIPFVPHMTVGAAPDSQSAERLASELAVRSRIVRGTISNLDLVDVDGPSVSTVATYAFGSAGGESC